MLEITNLHVAVQGKPVLKGLSLTVRAGETHAIMGPNGCGKSTLGYALSGRPGTVVTDGTVTFQGQDLLALTPEGRAQLGLFLAFQYPVEIPGVSNMYFLRTAVNAIRAGRGEAPMDAVDFLEYAQQKMRVVQMDAALAKRGVNEGFSGGEKKRNEILQMAVLEPTLAILDETDSGLDVDALRIVSDGVRSMRSPERAQIIITHYERLLEYLMPEHVHVLLDGRVVESGDMTLARRIDAHGYATAGTGA